MNILAIGAHPDDVELLCGGTLVKYANRGERIFIAIATNGNVGSPTLDREEIAAVRRAEAEDACSIIGAELIWMDFPDEWLFDDRVTRTRFIDAIRQARPDVMIVPSEADYHPDHRMAGRVAIDARIPSTVRLVETTLPAAEKIPHVFVMDTIAGIDFQPTAYVDVSDVFETKVKLLEAHVSQNGWTKDVYDDDLEALMVDQARRRGLEAGVRYAEAFQELRTYPRTGGLRLLPL